MKGSPAQPPTNLRRLPTQITLTLADIDWRPVSSTAALLHATSRFMPGRLPEPGTHYYLVAELPDGTRYEDHHSAFMMREKDSVRWVILVNNLSAIPSLAHVYIEQRTNPSTGTVRRVSEKHTFQPAHP